MQDEKTIWYENDAPVREYLDGELSKKSAGSEKNPKSMRFSWLEIMKKSFHAK